MDKQGGITADNQNNQHCQSTLSPTPPAVTDAAFDNINM
jgi:hypothetical protein